MVLAHYMRHTLFKCDCCGGKYEALPPASGRSVSEKDYCRICEQAWIRFFALAMMVKPVMVKGPR